MPPSSDPRINQLRTKIESERRNLEGAKAVMRAVEASSGNEMVIQQAQNEVRTAQASIRFLEDELARLQLAVNAGPSGSSPANNGQPSHGSASTQSSARQQLPGSGSAQPPHANRELPPTPSANTGTTTTKPHTQLDLLRYDAPLTGYKITHMLNQLEAKLQLENQYKTGIEKMANAYRMEGDRRLRTETDLKRAESEGKIQLLKKAKGRYERLAEFGAVDEVDEDLVPDFKRKEALRKPISGRLQITLKSARDLNHRTLSRRSSRAVETTVVVKVEGTMAWRSMMSRNDRWFENIEIPVTKANEVEITIYDNIGGDDTTPIGMLWLRVSDLMEALRRQKVAREEASNTDWVTADKAATIGSRPGAAPESATLHQNNARPFGGAAPTDPGGDGIDGWWAVEPAGALNMRLDFIKDNAGAGRRPYEALGRQGAVKKRKGDVHEMNGHKFVQRQFYQPIMCALCRELLLTGEGYQCEDCKYACHKRCYPKVVTKCISKPATDGEGDEEKINHRIPHRFQPYTNITANWCSHCGYMLPFGRKNSYKCSECGLTCHQACAHLIPDFCGMTMEMANTLLKNLREIGDRSKVKPARPSHSHSHSSSTSYSPAPVIVQPPKSDGPSATPPSISAPKLSKPDLPGKQLPAPPTQPQHQQLRPQPPTSTSRPSVEGRSSYEHRPSYDQRPSFDGRPDIANVTTGHIGGAPQKPAGQASTQLPAIYQPPAPTPPKQPSGYRPPAPAPLGVSQPPPSAPQVAYNKPVAPPQPQQQQVAPRKKRIGLDDFNFLAVLGKGNFGKVMLAEERQTTNLYAIKVLKKEFIIENDEVESTQSEKRVFLAAAEERHPFLLGLHSCFQTETRVYFVMEYVSGGDLMLHIQRRQFTLRQAKFYACEVLLALEYFHSRGIIYRDLKLDNILLTLDGHVKVADYGLCKEGMHYGQTTSTFCGTPEFMAPEILQEQPYGRAVDWWAFGVLTYEMLLGQSPFRGDDEDEIFDAIIEDEPLYPITMPREAVSLLQKLLTRDPQRRLGAGPDGALEIKRHQFFADVNFDDVYNKRIPPPYFPTIGNATDTSNFDKEFTREQPTLTPVHTQLTAQDQAEFAGFSWIAPWAAAQ